MRVQEEIIGWREGRREEGGRERGREEGRVGREGGGRREGGRRDGGGEEGRRGGGMGFCTGHFNCYMVTVFSIFKVCGRKILLCPF